MINSEVDPFVVNTYLQKYEKQYLIHVVDGIASIKLRENLGYIQPHNLGLAHLRADLTFKSKQHKNSFKKSIENLPIGINNESNKKMSIVFHESNLDWLATSLRVFHKGVVSHEEKVRRKTILDEWVEVHTI